MANNSNGRLWFTAGIDRSQLSRGVTAINKDFAGLRTEASQTGSAFSDMWKTAAAGVGVYLSATAALDMSKNIIDLTRQRELMEKSFEVLFGGADAAMQKIEEINQYAILSPYAFDNVAKGAQTMVSFGVSAEDIMPTLRMLGDVAAGNAQRFESLSLVYGQIQSAGRLMGQDLLQLINAGFNPLQVISEQTGESMLDLKKRMESGLISFDMVAGAFKSATSEGGKFYGMTDKMADSIEAAKSTFESAWVEKQIEWGNAAKDNIKTMYEFGSTVVENADDIAKVFAVLIAAVGSYKAALIAMSVTQSLVAGASSIKAFFSLAKGITSAKDAMLLLNTATKANPVGLIVSALAVAVTAFLAFRDSTEEAKTALEEFNEEQDKIKSTSESAIGVIQSETATMYQKVEAYKAMTKASKALAEAYTLEQLMAGEVTQAQIDSVLNVDRDASKYKMLTDQLEIARKSEKDYQEQLDARRKYSPKLSTYELEAAVENAQKQVALYEKELSNYNRYRAEANRLEAESARNSVIYENIKLLTDEKTTIEARAEAYEALKTLSPELTEMYGEEAVALMTLAQAQEAAANAEELAALRKQQASVQSDISALQASTGTFDIFTSTIDISASAREDLWLQAESIAQEINKVLARELTPTPKAELTKEQKRAFEREAEERRKMYKRGLLDYETFQQGVERLAQEHATRVAAYEVEATSPEQLTQLTTGSEAQMAEEIEALNEKHQTERYLALEAAREQIEINNDRIADEWEAEEAAFDKQQQLQKELLSQYATYQQKRDALTKEYEANRAAMYEDDGATLKSGFTQGNVDELDSSSAELLAELDSEMAQRSATFQTWADTTLAMGIKQLKVALATAKSALASDENLTDEERAILTEQIKVLQEKLDKSDSTEWGDTLKVMNEITDSVDNAINSFDGLDDATKSALSAATNIAGGIIGMITGIQALAVTGAEAIKGVERASVILAVIGAAVQIISSIANLFTARNKVAEETAQKNAELAQQELLAQYEINQLYRERYDWAKKIGETELQNAKRNMAEAEKQIAANKAEQAELLKKLQGEQYITGYHTEETGLFGWGKGETVEDKASLAGLSYDEILDLEEQGKLTDEAQAYLDALREATEEGEDLADKWAESFELAKELVVGMGFDEVVNHAMDDLLDGTKTAAEAFDEIMQGAMRNMLNEMMNEDVREWYEGFAAAGADGYTETEKEYWRQRWEDMQEENEKRKEEVEDITGESFDTADQGQADASDITSIQEEAPGSIDGKLTALQITSSQTAVNTTFLVEGQSSLRASVAEMRESMHMLNYYAKYTFEEVKLIRGHTENLSAIAASVATVATNTKNL